MTLAQHGGGGAAGAHGQWLEWKTPEGRTLDEVKRQAG